MTALEVALIQSLEHANQKFESALNLCIAARGGLEEYLHIEYGGMTTLHALAADYSFHNEEFAARAALAFKKAQELAVKYWEWKDERGTEPNQ